MEEFIVSCIDKFKELAGVRDIRPAPTPFLTEDHQNAIAGASTKGPCVECPWCKHTFPPGTVYESVEKLEAALLKEEEQGFGWGTGNPVGPWLSARGADRKVGADRESYFDERVMGSSTGEVRPP